MNLFGKMISFTKLITACSNLFYEIVGKLSFSCQKTGWFLVLQKSVKRITWLIDFVHNLLRVNYWNDYCMVSFLIWVDLLHTLSSRVSSSSPNWNLHSSVFKWFLNFCTGIVFEFYFQFYPNICLFRFYFNSRKDVNFVHTFLFYKIFPVLVRWFDFKSFWFLWMSGIREYGVVK